MYRLNVQVTAYGRQTVLIRAWSGHATHSKFGGSIHITGTAKPKFIKFCTEVGNKITYRPQNGRGYGHVTLFKFCRLP